MPQPDNKLRIPETLRNVKSIIGIFSAKGGVGKSAISLQLALALKEKGLKIGLVDADIYGPSQPVMLNSSPGELKLTKNEIIEPLTKEGIKFISMGLISGEKMPVIWRGPMVSGAVMQLLSQTEWGGIGLFDSRHTSRNRRCSIDTSAKNTFNFSSCCDNTTKSFCI